MRRWWRWWVRCRKRGHEWQLSGLSLAPKDIVEVREECAHCPASREIEVQI